MSAACDLLVAIPRVITVGSMIVTWVVIGSTWLYIRHIVKINRRQAQELSDNKYTIAALQGQCARLSARVAAMRRLAD